LKEAGGVQAIEALKDEDKEVRILVVDALAN